MQQIFTLSRSLTYPNAIPSKLRSYILELGNPYYPICFSNIRSATRLATRAILDPSTTNGLRRYTTQIIAMSYQTDLYFTKLNSTYSMCPNHQINKDGLTARPFLKYAIIVFANASKKDLPCPMQLPASNVSKGAYYNYVIVDTIDNYNYNNRYQRE